MRLESEGRLSLSLVCNRTGCHHEVVHPIVPFNTLTRQSLSGIDYIVIVTGPSYYHEVLTLLSSQHKILIEKPVAYSLSQLNITSRIIECNELDVSCAQIFRYHPLASLIRSLDIKQKDIHSIQATFVNPLGEMRENCDEIGESIEMNHMIDLLYNYKLINPLRSTTSIKSTSHTETFTIWPTNDQAFVSSVSGWNEQLYRERSIDIKLRSGNRYFYDFANNMAISTLNGQTNRVAVSSEESLVRMTLMGFISSFNDTGCPPNDRGRISTFAQSQELAKLLLTRTLCRSRGEDSQQHVVVIGGGFFGVLASIKLAAAGLRVSLLEQSPEILLHASLRNQWRHHSGFHYPLSPHTIQEICNAKSSFESFFPNEVIRDIPSLYFVSKWANEIPPADYTYSLNRFNLDYKEITVPAFVNSSNVSSCYLTDERIYDIQAIRQFLGNLIKSTGVELHTNSAVKSVYRQSSSSVFEVMCADHRQFRPDVVVDCSNGTSNYQTDIELFKDNERAEYQLVEILELELDIPPICLTFIDAPFLSLTSTGIAKRFFLSHKDFSVHSISNEIPDLAIPRESHKKQIITASHPYIPKLTLDCYRESHFAIKTIPTNRENQWDRSSEIYSDNCRAYAIISGKILTCVGVAEEITKQVQYLLSSLNHAQA